ncbi:MAG: hypothetical protein ABI718_08050 [Acidobacteriota bacterium]
MSGIRLMDLAVVHENQNPVKQFTRGVHVLREWLRENPPLDTRWVPVGWGVAFPSITVTSGMGPDLPRQLILDRADLDQPPESVERLFNANHGLEMEIEIDASRQKQLIDLLAPSCGVVPLPSDRVADSEPPSSRTSESERDRLLQPAALQGTGIRCGDRL